MKKLIKKILFAFASLMLFISLIAFYAYEIEPRRLVVHREELAVPNWSENLNGFKIVAISDVHGGSNYVTEEKLKTLVATANEQNPDLIVLLGDYVSQIGRRGSDLKMPSRTVAANLKGLRAKYGVYAVIGNHDWWYDEEKISAEFEEAGIRVLENEIERIPVGEETINLWGIEDYWKKRTVPTAPLDVLPERKNIIAITHNPDSLLKTPQEIAVMFAGHSHGGQVKFPFYGAIAFVNDRRFMAGHAEVDGKNVFVTTGVGCSGPQIRFRVPPEIAVININAKK